MQKKLFDDRTDREKALVSAREGVLKRKLTQDEEKKVLKRARQGDPWSTNKFYRKRGDPQFEMYKKIFGGKA